MRASTDLIAAGPAARIVVVDDDQGVRTAVADFLDQYGYAVESVADGRALERVLGRNEVDVVVLDVMLPGEDGLSILRRIAGGPGGPGVIMLSAMSDDTDRIVGLELGADDYVAKPCNPRELLARIKALLRRRQDRTEVVQPTGGFYLFAGWKLDVLRRELRNPADVLINLSSGEFNLLRIFVERPERVLSRDQLLDMARGPGSDVYDRAIDVQISRLRRKMRDESSGAELIRTVRNEGYMFTVRVDRR
jgi:two-component system, OmpR family, response regulator